MFSFYIGDTISDDGIVRTAKIYAVCSEHPDWSANLGAAPSFEDLSKAIRHHFLLDHYTGV